ncbi:hypothetical protein H8Z51_20630 [Mycobacterium avium subsp. hominissuis]|uniref:hypothetical protein n=2 Tax=Mycobacterium TaxID=1763 RepID=UPI001CE0642A|nr:hypothetical protein [Mycobacterium avium]MCA4761168.1 hypothetical protein [Mycobacterium avium subsp. hominissuis]
MPDQEGESVMKGLVAMFGLVGAVVVVIAWAITELIIRVAPLLLAAGCVWVAAKLVQVRRARRAAAEDGVPQRWGEPVAALPPAAPAVAGLPPVIAHRERMYVVRGEDTGLLSERDDGYVRVSAQALPRVERLPASYHHRRKVVARRVGAPRSGRRRP